MRQPAAAMPLELMELATGYYQSAGLYARQFATGKLGGDPVFAHLLQNGLLTMPSPTGRMPVLLDLGCGQGLLGACCLAAHQLDAAGRWPAGWAAAPVLGAYRGIELVSRDAARGADALHPQAADFRIESGDLRQSDLGQADIVVLLDVLHYLPTTDQAPLLAHIHTALPVGGRLIARIGNARGGWRGRVARWIDQTVWLARTGQRKPLQYRSANDWLQLLVRTGFRVESCAPVPGERFANQLIIARRA